MISQNYLNIKHNFNGGNISSDGGALLFHEFFIKTSMMNSLSKIPFLENRNSPVHSNHAILTQLIDRCLLGYHKQKHQSVLRNDPLLSLGGVAASQPTVSRFFQRVQEDTIVEMNRFMKKQAWNHINRTQNEIILDADSTLVTTDGRQEEADYIHHYSKVGYHPLVINEYNTKLLVNCCLRKGKAYSSSGIVEMLEETLPYFTSKHKKLIRFRGDSAFYTDDLMNYLESMSVEYSIRVKNFSRFTNQVYHDIYKRKINPDHYTAENPYYGEIHYKGIKSKKSRRVAYKAYSVSDKNGQLSLLPVVYAVITNKQDGTAKDIFDFYEERGNSENFTKELKNDFDGGKLSHHQFLKNHFEFLISAIAYNAFHIFQIMILKNKDSRMQMNSFREKFQKVAVRISKHARGIHLSFSSAYAEQKLFDYYLSEIRQL